MESGRRDPATGIRAAWPWTINFEGQGAWFETKAEAIQAVEQLQARGVRSIDVGCLQVNLMHHPAAFPSLAQAFEPVVNAGYAATFLVRLYGQTGNWTTATAHYHSANPAEGEPYAAKVLSVWPEEQRRAAATPPQMAAANAPPRGPPPSVAAAPISAFFRAPQASPAHAANLGLPTLAHAFPAYPMRQPPRMFAMAGMPPGGSAGMTNRAYTLPSVPAPEPRPAEAALPRIMPAGMMRAGTTEMASNGAIPLPMMRAGPQSPEPAIEPGANGRGLAFYRAAPVTAATPLRLTARLPFGALMR